MGGGLSLSISPQVCLWVGKTKFLKPNIKKRREALSYIESLNKGSEGVVYGSRFMNRGSSVPKSTWRPPMNLESSGLDRSSKRSQSISSNIIDQEKG